MRVRRMIITWGAGHADTARALKSSRNRKYGLPTAPKRVKSRSNKEPFAAYRLLSFNAFWVARTTSLARHDIDRPWPLVPARVRPTTR